MPTIVYDATIFTGKPGGLFPGCAPCVLTDRGTFRVPGGGPRDVNLGALLDWATGLPEHPGPVILDLEAEPLLDELAVRAVKRARPDLRVGFYAGPEHWPAFRWGDVAHLRRVFPSPAQAAAARGADFVAQALYPRGDAAEHLAAFRAWAHLLLARWTLAGVPALPIVTGHLHADASNAPVPDAVLTELWRVVDGLPEAVLWDGTRLGPGGVHEAARPFDPDGTRYAWRVAALAGRSR